MNIIKKLFGVDVIHPPKAVNLADPLQGLPKLRMSQDKAVLTILRARKNSWVPLPVISLYTESVCGSRCYSVHSRVAYLRKRYDLTIENYVELINGQRHSYYKLIETNQ
jgi:hypothetical protein